MLTQRYSRGRPWSDYALPLAAAGAQAAYNVANNYARAPRVTVNPPQVQNPPYTGRRYRSRPLPEARPGPPRRNVTATGRGRGRRLGGARQALVQNGSSGGASVTLRDMEVTEGVKADGTVKKLVFCPGKTGLTRLDAMGKTYDRYTLHTVTIRYKPTTAVTVSSTVSFGIESNVGPTTAPTASQVSALRPMSIGPCYVAKSITVGRNIQLMPFLTTSGDGATEVAFTLYYTASEATGKVIVGYFEIDYHITLSYPRPFLVTGALTAPVLQSGDSNIEHNREAGVLLPTGESEDHRSLSSGFGHLCINCSAPLQD